MADTTRKRSRTRWGAVAGVLVVGVAAAAAWQLRPEPASAETDKRPAPTTQEVTEGPLSISTRFTGKLSFADERVISSGLGGTVTELPPEGAVAGQNAVLFRIDNQPVVLLRGALPAWRDFTSGMSDGPDVRQLEQNLADFGHFEGTVDDRFTEYTAKAIRTWQKSQGLAEDGTIPLGRVIFGTSDLRVGAHTAALGSGAGAGTPMYTASTTAVTIKGDAPGADRSALKEGVTAEFALPDGTTAKGKISVVSAPQQRENQGKTKTVIPVTITPDDPAALVGSVPTTARITVRSQIAEKAVQVPVTALVATGEGAFGVEVSRKGKITTVPVELGTFASGSVEITKGDLKVGDDVVVPE